MADSPLFRSLTDKSELDALQWRARPVVVFADTGEDDGYREQIGLLEQAEAGLAERDIVVFSVISDAENDILRGALGVDGFALLLVGKDGGVKLRSDSPVTPERLFETIDRMPMRRNEMARD